MRPTLAMLTVTLLAAHAGAQARRPYIQQVTERSGIVAWRSAADEASRVCWGASPTSLTTAAGSGARERDHAVRIEGLSPCLLYTSRCV